MKSWIRIAKAIDTLNERIGRGACWLVLVVTLISAANALSRYGLGMSSNAWLEIQWYLFGAIFLLAAGFTLKHNGHVRIDVLYGRWSPRVRAWIDLFGTIAFLLPLCTLMVWLSWHGFIESLQRQEISADAGGLLRWPVRLLIPLGFALLGLQGVAEFIKRVAFLRGQGTLPHESPLEEV
ncbi:MAG: TRAP transporter small permease subunit [Gammaproteobacteria bacterium]|nr:TRAP transporter small permease subunit [Gammaproteobacteria bacterium]